MNTQHKGWDMQVVISNTLRWGVTIASVIAFVGGILYLCSHGTEPMPDYQHFAYGEAATAHPEYTTPSGIIDGLCHGSAYSWIQLGVVCLLLTPIMRVVLSLIDFVREHDWLYATISAIVLGVIISNSLGIIG